MSQSNPNGLSHSANTHTDCDLLWVFCFFMEKLQVFSFENLPIRMSVEGEDVFFVAKDVSEALGYTWKGISGTIPHVPEEWRGVHSVQTPSGTQEMAVLSEQGLYFFLAWP